MKVKLVKDVNVGGIVLFWCASGCYRGLVTKTHGGKRHEIDGVVVVKMPHEATEVVQLSKVPYVDAVEEYPWWQYE